MHMHATPELTHKHLPSLGLAKYNFRVLRAGVSAAGKLKLADERATAVTEYLRLTGIPKFKDYRPVLLTADEYRMLTMLSLPLLGSRGGLLGGNCCDMFRALDLIITIILTTSGGRAYTKRQWEIVMQVALSI